MERCRCCPGACRKPRKKRGGKKQKGSKKPQEIVLTLKEPSVRSAPRLIPTFRSSILPEVNRQTEARALETTDNVPIQIKRQVAEALRQPIRFPSLTQSSNNYDMREVFTRRSPQQTPVREPVVVSAPTPQNVRIEEVPTPTVRNRIEEIRPSPSSQLEDEPRPQRISIAEMIARRRGQVPQRSEMGTQTITTAGRPSGAEKAEYDANKEPGETYADYRIRTRDQTLGVFNVKSN